MLALPGCEFLVTRRMKPATKWRQHIASGISPRLRASPVLVPFFPSFIAACGGDEGRKKRELVVQRLEPHADAWGYMLSLLRSWFSGCFTQSIDRISIHFCKSATPKLTPRVPQSLMEIHLLALRASKPQAAFQSALIPWKLPFELWLFAGGKIDVVVFLESSSVNWSGIESQPSLVVFDTTPF